MKEFSSNDAFYDALRLSEAERQALLSQLAERARHGSADNNRQEPRMTYSLKAIIVQMHHPGGSSVNYLVRPRNLSAGGVGFLHGSFCYTGTPVQVVLRDVDGKNHPVKGKVVRCQHLQGVVHEVGVAFDDGITVDQFIGASVAANANGGMAQRLPRLGGRVLHVDSHVDDRELLTFQLTQLGVHVDAVSTVAEAQRKAEAETFHAVITEMKLDEDNDGYTLAAALHEAQPSLPTILLTRDHSQAAADLAAQAGIETVITKPYALDHLVAVLRPLLPAAADPDAQPLLSEHWDNRRMRPLISDYLSRLSDQIRELEQLAGDGSDRETLVQVAARMRGSAGGYGFPSLTEAADRLQQLAADQADLSALRRQVAEVTRLCRAACAARDEADD